MSSRFLTKPRMTPSVLMVLDCEGGTLVPLPLSLPESSTTCSEKGKHHGAGTDAGLCRSENSRSSKVPPSAGTDSETSQQSPQNPEALTLQGRIIVRS